MMPSLVVSMPLENSILPTNTLNEAGEKASSCEHFQRLEQARAKNQLFAVIMLMMNPSFAMPKRKFASQTSELFASSTAAQQRNDQQPTLPRWAPASLRKSIV